MSEHYKWDGQTSKWVERMRKSSVIGRIHNISFVTHSELYHLHLLLYHIKDAISFDGMGLFGAAFLAKMRVCEIIQ